MDNDRIVVLYVFHEARLSGGATYSGINMLKSLDFNKIKPIVVIPDKGNVEDVLMKMGIKTIVAPINLYFKGHVKSNYFVRIVFFLWKLLAFIKNLILDCLYVKRSLKKEHIDIVHSNTSGILAGYVLSMFFNCKHIWHLREFIDKDFHEEPYLGFKFMRKIINSADATISISGIIRKHWISPLRSNSYQVYNAVKSIDDVKPIVYSKEKFFLFCANRIEAFKGAMWAVEAFGKSNLFDDGYKMIFLGTCSCQLKNKLLDKAREYKAEKSIDFLGYSSDPSEYFAKASAFLMCSDFEAMGRTTVEAFWYGCPVLGRNTGGTPELVKDGVTGYLFNSIDELAVLMKNIVNEEIIGMVENAQAFAIDNFTEEKYGQKIESIYESVIPNYNE